MYATVQAYNRQGNIYLNDKEYFKDSLTAAVLWVEKQTWPNTKGVSFIKEGYFEELFKNSHIEFIDEEKNRFVADIIYEEGDVELGENGEVIRH